MDIFRSRRLSVEKNLYAFPNGVRKEKIVVKPADAVAILPVEGNECCLIRQYRFAIGEYILEAPAGTMDEGETPEGTAHRELIEETGLSAGRLISRGFIYTTPGFTTERIFLFEARDLAPSHEFTPDEDEVIEVRKINTNAIPQMICDGRIVDAKTICLFYRCFG
ncbi:MAG: NUDIX hydrolase [Methanomicrobiales archaeon]|nr:NUDIX hydrolase [Methanomicrobiales archaeon]